MNEQKLWRQLGREMGLDSTGKSLSSLSHSLKSAYVKYVHPYEEFLARNDSSSPPISSDQEHSPLKEESGTKTREVKEPYPSTTTFSSRDLKSKAIPVIEGHRGEKCQVCTNDEHDEKMLLCDGCDRGFHTFCLQPPLETIPKSDWYCAKCIKNTGKDYGFQDGEERCLYQFQYIADTFKKNWFRSRHGKGDVNGNLRVTEAEVEREFWRLIESTFENVEVEYGADLHSSLHGSGFPVAEKNPNNKYSKCPWNLNNLPVLGNSLFQHIKGDISGMMVPWLYVGMVFSTFCWHTEDHYTYSANYMHWGETKTWYGIPASNADLFEQTMKETLPDLFKSNPDLLFHLTTLLSPGALTEKGVSVYTLDQRPGEFVITFPRGYHAGFNHGFNFAEAVNFAPPDWLPFGHDCVERYHLYKKNPVFAHEEVVISTLGKKFSVESAQWYCFYL